MSTKKFAKRASVFVAASLVGLLFSFSAHADKGVIALANSKCFVIDTPMGYVLVDGWVNCPKGTVVIGKFNTYGSVKIFDTNGNDVSGYIYIEDWGFPNQVFLKNRPTNALDNIPNPVVHADAAR